jgi:hypothetical protein
VTGRGLRVAVFAVLAVVPWHPARAGADEALAAFKAGR